MARVTFGVAANIAVKQNAQDFTLEYSMDPQTVETLFYVDNCLTGADDVETAIILQKQLCDLFTCGGLLLRKWNSNNNQVLEHIPHKLLESSNVHAVVLNCLSGNPRRFKTYVGNRVSSIVDQIPPDRWSHVIRAENPADCASRGIFP